MIWLKPLLDIRKKAWKQGVRGKKTLVCLFLSPSSKRLFKNRYACAFSFC